MNISNIPFEFTFIPENPGEKDIEGLTGNYDLKNPGGVDFRELCRDLVWYHFMEAWEDMRSFFEDTKIESIGFVINLTPGSNNLASVRISRSRPFRSVEARPVFCISRTLLDEYLSSYWINDYRIPFFESTALHHELVHVLDKFEEEDFGLEEGLSRGKSLLLHFLRFRSEGIAELLYILYSGTGIRDIGSARKMFETELYRVFEISLKNPRDYIKLSKELPETGSFYDLGPWMILHVLGCPGNPGRYGNIDKVLENLEQDFKPDEDTCFSLLRKALEISNYSFLKYITEPGPDGKPFISKKEMSAIVKMTGQIGLKKPNDISFEDRDVLISDYYTNKIIRLYNQWGRISKTRKRKIVKPAGLLRPDDYLRPQKKLTVSGNY